MSFAQTSSAEGVPTVLQNGAPGLHIVDASTPALVTSAVFVASKSFAISPPPGRYHFIGSAQLETTVAATQCGISMLYDGTVVFQQGGVSTPRNLSILPMSGALVVTDAGQLLEFQVYSAAGGARVDVVDLILIRVA